MTVRFNPNTTTSSDKAMLARYIQARESARKHYIRTQRLGDIALGGLFALVGFITVQMIAGIGR
jgi:hypothetical protein